MKRHQDQSNLEKKEFLWCLSCQRVRIMTNVVESVSPGRRDTGAVAGSSGPDNWEWLGLLKSQSPPHSDTSSPTKPYLLIFSQQSQQLGTKYLNIQACGGGEFPIQTTVLRLQNGDKVAFIFMRENLQGACSLINCLLKTQR